MSGSVHRSVYASFVPPEVHTFAYVPPNGYYEVKDDETISFPLSCCSEYKGFDQIRQQIAKCAPGLNFRQVDFRYTVHPPECGPGLASLGFANPFGHTVWLNRKKLSPEDLTKVLECCDQRSEDPDRAIANTRTCWEKIFSTKDLDGYQELHEMHRKYAEPCEGKL